MVSPIDDIPTSSTSDASDAPNNSTDLPALSSTLNESPPEFAGFSGECLFNACKCKFYTGISGECSECGHGNLYHCVKPSRADVLARESEISRSQQLFTKRKIREAREAESQRIADEINRPMTVVVNNFPCTISECECAKFIQPITANNTNEENNNNSGNNNNNSNNNNNEVAAGNENSLHSSTSSPSNSSPNPALVINTSDSLSLPSLQTIHSSISSSSSSSSSSSQLSNISLLPRVCKKCRHAEFYHIKGDVEEKKKGKSAAAKSPKKKK